MRAQLAASGPSAASSPAANAATCPGWVLITLMTAGLVAVLWAVAEDQLKALFTDALDSARR